ncbi:hypothetical protein [Pseudomarimonas salicorniae]|uniref:Uncharacterized protein n=1 Tax=Pseudomarimonas salicorniae TaxID=2933270 RepID=A0ABT0GDU2_9GAMM|nr:hypothetical protein [Lysobacter sp. CAU 1642]MCK7592185.1 hypothetical protein [Lysobacter sp. CAU 1642]
MVDPTQPEIEDTRMDGYPPSEGEDQAPQAVVRHQVVDDDEWGEIEEIVVYSDAA